MRGTAAGQESRACVNAREDRDVLRFITCGSVVEVADPVIDRLTRALDSQGAIGY